MSATVPKDAKLRIKELVPNIIEYKISARKAITDNILPDPKVVLIKLFLNTKDKTECIVLNKGKGKPIELDWEHRSGYMKAKYPEITVNFMQIFLSSLLGGCLGILFLIPFRKYFVQKKK